MGNKNKAHKGICKLCGRNVLLIQSHVIPRWAYVAAKKDRVNGLKKVHTKVINNKFLEANPNLLSHQDQEVALCKLCDNDLLGNAEGELKKFTSNTSRYWDNILNDKNNNFSDLISKEDDLNQVHPIDRKYLLELGTKNFNFLYKSLFGILYKAHYSTKPVYNNVILSEVFLEKIRLLLLSNNNSDYDDMIHHLRIIGVRKHYNFFIDFVANSVADFWYIEKLNDNFYTIFVNGYEFTLQLTTEKSINGMGYAACDFSTGRSYMIIDAVFLNIAKLVTNQNPPFDEILIAPENYLPDYDLNSQCPCVSSHLPFKNCCYKNFLRPERKYQLVPSFMIMDDSLNNMPGNVINGYAGYEESTVNGEMINIFPYKIIDLENNKIYMTNDPSFFFDLSEPSDEA